MNTSETAMTAGDLASLNLSYGAHRTREEGTCLTEAVAWHAGEEHTDRPRCMSPVLARFGSALNDRLADGPRQQLKRFIPLLPGTAGDPGADQLRAWMARDWLIRVRLLAWLECAGLTEDAAAVRRLAPVLSQEALDAARLTIRWARQSALDMYDGAGTEQAILAADAAGAAAAAAGIAIAAGTVLAARAAEDPDPILIAADTAGHDLAADIADRAVDAVRFAFRACGIGSPSLGFRSSDLDCDEVCAAARAAARERVRPVAELLPASSLELFGRMITLEVTGMTVADIAGREPLPELPPASERARLRKRLGISQRELAAALGVSRQAVVAWERGSEPTGQRREDYARILRAWQSR